MNKNHRNFLELMITGQMFGMFALFYFIFVRAFLNPRKTSCIAIDVVGEANIEIVIMSFFLVLFFCYVLYRAKIFVKEVEQ